MKQPFDFSQVGKQMPYNVPDGFFDQLEKNVMHEVGNESSTKKNKTFTLRKLFRPAIAIAAAIAIFFVVQMTLHKNHADDFEAVELAYNNLTTEDQEFLMEIYEEDLFINEIE